MQVTIRGEAIGDIIRGGNGYCWVTLKEPADTTRAGHVASNASISVYLSTEQATLIKNLGRYGVDGSILEVVGIFHLACGQHEGLSDVHATSVSLVASGGIIEHRPDIGLLVLGAVLICASGVLMLLYRFLRERQR